MSGATMTEADALREAKDVLLQDGWRPKGGPVEPGDPCCAFQAIQFVYAQASLSVEYHRLMRFFNRAIDGTDTALVGRIWDWNDRQPSVEPVLAAFDRAIALAEAEASR